MSDTVAEMIRRAFMEHQGELIRHIRAPDAEDIVQETFARAMKIKDPAAIGSMKGYLFQIARHVSYDFRKKGRRDQHFVQYDSELVEMLSDREGSISIESEEGEHPRSAHLKKVLASLPDSHRTILLLIKVKGLSYKEAAVESGYSVHTIKKYLFQTMQWFRHGDDPAVSADS